MLNLVGAHAVHWLEAEWISDAPTGLVYFLLLNLLNSIRHLFAVDWLVGKKAPNFTWVIKSEGEARTRLILGIEVLWNFGKFTVDTPSKLKQNFNLQPWFFKCKSNTRSLTPCSLRYLTYPSAGRRSEGRCPRGRGWRRRWRHPRTWCRWPPPRSSWGPAASASPDSWSSLPQYYFVSIQMFCGAYFTVFGAVQI